VVGSPDPHGPERARSRDGYYGIDLGLFLGTFLYYVSDFSVKLDTEVTGDDLKKNFLSGADCKQHNRKNKFKAAYQV
jgi:hypothetical protein